MKLIAECCCGQCQIEFNAKPTFHGVCHCKNCRKRTGSAFGISAYFDKHAISKKKGKTHTYSLHHTERNHDQQRHFCQTCGTTLFWYISEFPDKIGVAGGCFIKTPLDEPTMSLSDSQKCLWVGLPNYWKVNG